MKKVTIDAFVKPLESGHVQMDRRRDCDSCLLQKEWIKKCYTESQKPNTIVVALIPARTDTRYFHDFIYHKAKEIRFIKGRLKFGNAQNSAPFPSMVVVWK